MNIHFASFEPNRTGGGWTQGRYLVDHFGQAEYEKSDIYFIMSASMVQRDAVQKAKQDGKKIVLRVDNAIRNSRNRNTGMTRLYDYAQWSDLVIYQSEWARRFLVPFLKKDGEVILNGVDTNLYNPTSRAESSEDTYLYARSSRDEGKNWISAWYWYVEQHAKNPDSKLEIAGKFSHENLEYNFDFYNGEQYRFVGEQPNLVDCFKRNKYFLYSFVNDACSNTLLEARASGCEIIDVYGALGTGGAPEIMQLEDLSIELCMEEYESCLARID